MSNLNIWTVGSERMVSPWNKVLKSPTVVPWKNTQPFRPYSTTALIFYCNLTNLDSCFFKRTIIYGVFQWSVNFDLLPNFYFIYLKAFLKPLNELQGI